MTGRVGSNVVTAVTGRFARGNGFAAPTQASTNLARRVVERVSSVDTVRCANSGTEATMNAVRAAIAHTGNDHVLKLDGIFHGTHDTVLVGVKGDGRKNSGIPANVEERVSTVPFNDTDAHVEALDDVAAEATASTD